jgi:tetraacyldisaccharide-1-P 4'-kinase
MKKAQKKKRKHEKKKQKRKRKNRCQRKKNSSARAWTLWAGIAKPARVCGYPD